ncbi:MULTISPECIES: TadE/TadG family type IV pilus assembly protein [unclassified Streptomyces]|uniref:TadE/TadG family type IV pilus assembly protein n=1 Tax=unclassified Streptomyces TaxID=2593676 RepID=UPI00225A3F64|nr:MULTISPECIES: TadE family protein [unclassified Streptomyces]MCX4627883.1 pilus assembly protein [Streptomyces sp. NBC_01443]WSW43976.1 pilus assembly protein [Streptomyces sp. NBC_01001]
MPARRPVRAARAARGDRGQVAVEFVGMVPLILLLVAAVWECVLIGYAFSLAGNAADEAARVGAVHGGGACDAAARRHVGGAWNMSVDCRESGDVYKATVKLNLPVFFPGLDIGTPITGEGGSAKEEED